MHRGEILFNFMQISYISHQKIAPNYRIFAIRRLGIGCSGTTTKVYWWTFVHLGCGRLLLKMGWNCQFNEVKNENAVNFIRINICCFGIPPYAITDNCKPFDNKLMNRIYDIIVFRKLKSFMYHAATNGLAETFFKTLCNLLKKVVSKFKWCWQ